MKRSIPPRLRKPTVSVLIGVVFAAAWLVRGGPLWWISILAVISGGVRALQLYRVGGTDTDEGALAGSRAELRAGERRWLSTARGSVTPAPTGSRWPGCSCWPRPAWLFLACVSDLAQQAHLKHLPQTRSPDPITPVTVTAVAGLFVIIVLLGRSHGWPARLAGAAIGALAAPMIFEFPFDFIVLDRIYPPIPAPHLALFFGPLFLVEIITLALLSLSPMVRLSRATFFGFASVLAVFAVWGLFGFGYPSAPLPYTLNVVSKILAFVTALSLFLRRPDSSAQAVPLGEDAELVPLPSQVSGGRADDQAGDPFGG
jgi:hypothetical protein